MRKLKVYLDTSVISHLLQEDVPEKMADCPEPKKSKMYEYLGQINYTPLEITDDVSGIAQQIIDMGIL